MDKFRLQLSFVLLSALLIFCFCLFGRHQAIGYAQLQSDSQAQEITALINELRNVNLQKNDPDKIFNAMHRLMELKSLAAIDDLINLISFEKQYSHQKTKDGVITMSRIIPISARYPAIRVLASIGRPALPALVKVIEENSSESMESYNALITIMEIFNHKSDAVDYLTNAMKQSPSKENSRRISYFIEEAKKDCALHRMQE
jgi:hypothetical protein